MPDMLDDPATMTPSQRRRLLEQAGLVDIAIDRYKINWFWGLMTTLGRRGPPDKAPEPAAPGRAGYCAAAARRTAARSYRP